MSEALAKVTKSTSMIDTLLQQGAELWAAEMFMAARTFEQAGKVARQNGRTEIAIASYEAAKNTYDECGLAWHERGESELANDTRKAINRCRNMASNLRQPPKAKRPPATTTCPNCLTCNKPLRRFKFDGEKFKDGTPREWGDYGDNRFCGLHCGWKWACGHTTVPKGKGKQK